MSDHTPGPWRVRYNEDGFPKIVRAATRTVAAPMWTDRDGDPNRQVADANARLIAAAPDMLDALQSIASLDGDSMSDAGDAVDIARDALERADG